MKRVFAICFLFTILLLYSCQYTHSINESDPIIYDLSVSNEDIQSMILNEVGSNEPIPPASLVYYYVDCNNQYYDYYLYETFIDSRKQSFLGVYISNTLVEILNSFDDDVYIPPTGILLHTGIDKMLYKYQIAYFQKLINIQQYPLLIFETNDNEIPLERENYKLITVLTKNAVRFSRIDGKEVYNSNLLFYTSGNITDDSYISLPESLNKNDTYNYLYCSFQLKDYYTLEYAKTQFIPIKIYNNKECIYELCGDLDGTIYYESYYEFIKGAIIKENESDYYYDHYYIYNYKKIKQQFLKEFYKRYEVY